jgi:hypothetical protein
MIYTRSLPDTKNALCVLDFCEIRYTSYLQKKTCRLNFIIVKIDSVVVTGRKLIFFPYFPDILTDLLEIWRRKWLRNAADFILVP